MNGNVKYEWLSPHWLDSGMCYRNVFTRSLRVRVSGCWVTDCVLRVSSHLPWCSERAGRCQLRSSAVIGRLPHELLVLLCSVALMVECTLLPSYSTLMWSFTCDHVGVTAGTPDLAMLLLRATVAPTKGRYLSVWVAELAIFCAHKRVWPLFRSSVINGLQKRSELHLAKRLPRANMNWITCFDHVLHVLIKIYLRRSFFVR